MALLKQTILSSLLLLTIMALLSARAHGAEAQRTSLLVRNMTCGSCLTKITEGLRGLDQVFGMAGDTNRGVIIVDHRPGLGSEELAAVITGLGYPAVVDWTADISEQDALSPGRKASAGCGCCNRSASGYPAGVVPATGGPSAAAGTDRGIADRGRDCTAAAAAWKDLYRKIIATISPR